MPDLITDVVISNCQSSTEEISEHGPTHFARKNSRVG